MRYQLDGKPATRGQVVAALAAVGLPEAMAVHFAWDEGEHQRDSGGKFTVTRDHLAARLAEKLGLTHAKAREAVGHVLDGITLAMDRGHRVELRHFGVFEKKQHVAKAARNPRTGEKMTIPAQKRISFKPGKRMKRAAK